MTEEHDLAWDCGTGTGQAALKLIDHYRRVIATDASASQIDLAEHRQGVEYRVLPAERSGLAPACVDLVTVAQALHWFDLDAFSTEVDRVLKPGGLIGAWAYRLLRVAPEIDTVVEHLYTYVLGAYWPEERRLVEEGYQGLCLPFGEVAAPPMRMHSQWNLRQLLGYLNTWSAVKRYQHRHGLNPLQAVYQQLANSWGDPERLLTVTWPMSIRVWRKKAGG